MLLFAIYMVMEESLSEAFLCHSRYTFMNFKIVFQFFTHREPQNTRFKLIELIDIYILAYMKKQDNLTICGGSLERVCSNVYGRVV